MNLKAKTVLILSVIGFCVGFVFIEPLQFGICSNTYSYSDGGEAVGCLDKTQEYIGQPVVLFSVAVFVVSLTLLFLREEVFRSWLRFTKWYLPIAAVVITWSAVTGSGGGWGGPNLFDSEMMSWFTAVLFLAISLILIVVKSIQLRGVGK